MAPEFEEIDRKVGWLIINKFTYRIMRALGRRSQPKIDTEGVTISEEQSIGIGTFVVKPKQRASTGALLLIHGGGFVISSAHDLLPQAVSLARKLGVTVVCPGYRLAPDAPFPAGLDDCHAAWNWLLEHADGLGVDTNKIVLGGWSAGAGIAACLAQRLLDEGATQPIAQLLVYPMLDDRTATRRDLDKPRHRVWSNRNNLFGWSSYLGHPAGRPPAGQPGAAYSVAARRADLSGLPPAWVGVGTCDLFLDEDRTYAERLSEAGVETTYVEVAGAIHGFDLAGTELGAAFNASQLAFIQRFTD